MLTDHQKPEEKAVLKRVFPYLGETKAAPLDVNVSSSSDSDEDYSSWNYRGTTEAVRSI